jgi:hypothetical protein
MASEQPSDNALNYLRKENETRGLSQARRILHARGEFGQVKTVQTVHLHYECCFSPSWSVSKTSQSAASLDALAGARQHAAPSSNGASLDQVEQSKDYP